jgi:H+/Cl- antiporter ClcA
MLSFFSRQTSRRQRRRARVHLFDLWYRGATWIIGPLLVGLAAVLLALGGDHATNFHRWLFTELPLLPLVMIPAGFALLAFLGQRYFPGAQGGGIPQTIAAMSESDPVRTGRLLSLRIAFGKAMLTLGALSLGGSMGREGPTVQIGASIMHAFHGRRPFRSAGQRRTLILAGGAAGIAAAFNTPLAGIMFVIEELSKRHVFNAGSATLRAVIFSGLVSLFLLGNYTYFGATTVSLDWRSSISAILVCGLVGGLLGGLFSRMMTSISTWVPRRIVVFAGKRPFAFAAMCGLGVAVLGVATGGLVFGTGYEPTRMTLEDTGNLPWYFGVAKAAATLLSAVSGIPGGIFAPSLAVGAGLGDNIAALLPALAPHSAIILLVMASYLSAVTREPLTSFVIMMEMTGSHEMLLPLMSATLLASSVSRLIGKQPLYQELADRLLAPPLPPQSPPAIRPD